LLHQVNGEDFIKAFAVGHPFYIFFIDPDIVDRAGLVQHLAAFDNKDHLLAGRPESGKQQEQEEGEFG